MEASPFRNQEISLPHFHHKKLSQLLFLNRHKIKALTKWNHKKAIFKNNSLFHLTVLCLRQASSIMKIFKSRLKEMPFQTTKIRTLIPSQIWIIKPY